MNFIIQFWSMIVVPSGIKSEPSDEFVSLGCQKVDFHVLEKKVNFSVKNKPIF